MELTDLTAMSNGDLVARLSALCLEGHRLTGRLLVHLGEVEERRLDLETACTSMFDFCVRRLGMSEGAAFRRIVGARLVRRFPRLLPHIERGELHLSNLVLLRSHLTEENLDDLVAAALGKTHREVAELIARIAPRPDVPDAIRERPNAGTAHAQGSLGVFEERPSVPSARSRVEPLAEARFVVQLTASTALRDKLERARDLMRHRNPDGDLATIVEQALDELLAKLERERLGKAKRPAPTPRRTKSERVSRSVRREVFERDGEQCTFRDDEGRRCPARALLELDHVTSRALGGNSDASNLRVLCRAHNRLHAERVFGKDHVRAQIHLRQRKSASPESDVALRALIGMGFAKSDAVRALDVTCRRRAGDLTALSLPAILREAIAALT